MSIHVSPNAPLDSETIKAIQVLSDAVRSERVPGVIEFSQLERALERATAEATEERLAEAASAFRALDQDFRTRIVARAGDLARQLVEGRRDTTLEPPPPPAPPAARPAVFRPRRVRGASPFLSALNQGRPQG